MELELSAVLKTYTPGTQLQFVLAWTRADGTAGEAASEWIDGPEFRARLELPMNEGVEALLRLQSADGIIQQQDLVLDLPGLSAEDFQLSAGSLSGLYSIAVGMGATATAEDPAIRVWSPYPELFWPETAQLTVTHNGEVLETTTLSLTEEETGGLVWPGRPGRASDPFGTGGCAGVLPAPDGQPGPGDGAHQHCPGGRERPAGEHSAFADKLRETEEAAGRICVRRPCLILLNIHHPGIPPQGVFPVVGLPAEHVGHGPRPEDAGEAAPEEQAGQFRPAAVRAQQAHGLEMALVPPQGGQDIPPGQGPSPGGGRTGRTAPAPGPGRR